MTDKLVPALIGGVILGILSSIPFVNYCCCIWAIGGGLLAVMMYVKKSPSSMSMGEGAMLGAMTGVIGGVIYFVLANIIALIVGTAAMDAALKQTGVNIPLSGVALILLITFLTALFLVVLSTVGGLIAIPIFEKRKVGDAPPPPPAFGGQGGGGNFGAGA